MDDTIHVTKNAYLFYEELALLCLDGLCALLLAKDRRHFYIKFCTSDLPKSISFLLSV